VADRFSVLITKRHEYQEAAQVLRQARMANPGSAEVAKRIRRRLARCERDRAEYHSPDRDLTASRRASRAGNVTDVLHALARECPLFQLAFLIGVTRGLSISPRYHA
jgi:hypothetical protein